MGKLAWTVRVRYASGESPIAEIEPHVGRIGIVVRRITSVQTTSVNRMHRSAIDARKLAGNVLNSRGQHPNPRLRETAKHRREQCHCSPDIYFEAHGLPRF